MMMLLLLLLLSLANMHQNHTDAMPNDVHCEHDPSVKLCQIKHCCRNSLCKQSATARIHRMLLCSVEMLQQHRRRCELTSTLRAYNSDDTAARQHHHTCGHLPSLSDFSTRTRRSAGNRHTGDSILWVIMINRNRYSITFIT